MTRAWRGGRAAGMVIGAGLLLALASRADAFDGTQNLDLYQGTVIASGRILGLAGAFTGVAEGQDGEPFNVCSLAQRDRRLDTWWDWDFVLTTHVPGLDSLGTQDLDNDGRLETDLTSRGNVQLGAALQIHRFGIGLLVRQLVLAAPTADHATLELAVQDIALGMAYGFLDEDVVLGVELALVNALVQRFTSGVSDPELAPSAGYAGYAVRLAALWRPRGRNLRLGAQLDPGSRLTLPGGAAPLEGVLLPPAMVRPLLIRAGGAVWLGPNAGQFNDPSPQSRREDESERRRSGRAPPEPPPVLAQGRVQPVMVSLDVSLVEGTPNGAGLGSFIRQGQGAASPEAGRNWTVAPHLGAEWEALADWIILRGGTYLEPSRYGIAWRPHGTAGFDVKIPVPFVPLRLSAAADLASRYQNVAFSLGLWRSVGPVPPSPVPAHDPAPAPAVPVVALPAPGAAFSLR